MPNPSALAAAVLACLAIAGCTQPSWRPAAPGASSALARVDRAAVLAIACRYDRQPVPCGDYLLQRLVPMLEGRPEIRELAISESTVQCRAEGAGTLCEVSARVRFVQGGRAWPVRVDMRYRAPEHRAYLASARTSPNPLGDPAIAALAPVRDVLDRLVAAVAQESERAMRQRAS